MWAGAGSHGGPGARRGRARRGRAPAQLRPELFDPDEAAIAAQAIAVRDGGTLYVEAVDRKPPLPSLIYAAAFDATGSTDLRPLHGLAAAGLVGAALVLAFDARRRWGGWPPGGRRGSPCSGRWPSSRSTPRRPTSPTSRCSPARRRSSGRGGGAPAGRSPAASPSASPCCAARAGSSASSPASSAPSLAAPAPGGAKTRCAVAAGS